MGAPETAPLIRYDVTIDAVRAMGPEYAGLTADTPAGYEQVRLAIGRLRETRVGIEARRVELKADALAYGRRVDSVARDLTEAIEEIEVPLKAKKAAVDAAKERARQEAEAEERRKVEAALLAQRAEEDAIRAAAQAVEDARLAEERARLAAERAAIDEARRVAEAAARVERERVAAERAQVAAERKALADAQAKVAQEELDRRARIRIEGETRAQAERERIAAEEARVAEAERQARADARLAALRPDVEKVRAYGAALLAVPVPTCAALEATVAVAAIGEHAAVLALWEGEPT